MRLRATATFRPRSDAGRFTEAVVTPAVRASVEASCALIEASAKGYCPVDTGRLQASIDTTIEELPKTIRGYVAPRTDYAAFVEFGTRKMSAQPYMRPAYEENKGAIAELFRSNIGTAINA